MLYLRLSCTSLFWIHHLLYSLVCICWVFVEQTSTVLCSSTCGSNLHIKAHVHNQHLNLFCESYLATMECIQQDCRTLMIQFVQIWSALQPDGQPFTERCWCVCVFIAHFLCGPTLDYLYYLAIRACKDRSAAPHKQTARMSLLCKFHNVPIRSNDMGSTEI